MLAASAVHTTGVNWTSVGTLMIAFVVAVGGGVGFIIKRLDRNRDRTEIFVTSQVSGVTSAVAGRLDRIDQHLAAQDLTVAGQNERLARVEGRLLIPPATDSS
jgi:hypothetical protein